MSRWSRRAWLQATLGAGVLLRTPLDAAAQAVDSRSQRPQAGDRFVFAEGAQQGQVVGPADVLRGKPPIKVYPFDPVSRTVRTLLQKGLLAKSKEQPRGKAELLELTTSGRALLKLDPTRELESILSGLGDEARTLLGDTLELLIHRQAQGFVAVAL